MDVRQVPTLDPGHISSGQQSDASHQENGQGLNGSLSAATAAADSFLSQVNTIEQMLLDENLQLKLKLQEAELRLFNVRRERDNFREQRDDLRGQLEDCQQRDCGGKSVRDKNDSEAALTGTTEAYYARRYGDQTP